MDNQPDSAFGFSGTWKEYAPIAFSNLLLNIVTLGFYRFWAKTRTRTYLWSRTRFIDDTLEWTGTGKELFVGFLMVLLLFGGPFLFLQFGAQALVLQGYAALAVGLSILALAILFYFAGVARFRALRYRLSRTYWRGIRGGSNTGGFGYGASYMWKSVAGALPLWLLVPWSMMSLWNERWRQMSFGPHAFTAHGRAGPIFSRFLLFYLSPFLLVIAGLVMAATMGLWVGNVYLYSNYPPVLRVVALFVVVAGVYALLGIIALAYYAAFLREAIGGLALDGLDFRFEARTDDWLKLFFGDIVLVLCTLGVGWLFLEYRHWKFFITHMEAYGEIDLDRLTQSDTKRDQHGEGLLDALDVGAL